MTSTGIIFIIVSALIIITGSLTGIAQRTRKGRRIVRIFGETGSRIFYLVLGLGFLVAAFFV